MPVTTTYPGVYIDEQATSSHVISGVSTSVTAFVGAAQKGTPDQPTRVTSNADFVREFGAPIDATTHPMGYAVAHFFMNGGSQAVIVRALAADAEFAQLPLGAGQGITITLAARSRGVWATGTGTGPTANGLFAEVVAATGNPHDRFGLTIVQWESGAAGQTEHWDELSMSPSSPRFVTTVLAASQLVSAKVSGAEATAPGTGTSTGATDISGGVTELEGRTLRIAVDQHAPADYVLWPAAPNPATSHSTGDVVTFINDPANHFPVEAADDGGKVALKSRAAGRDSTVTVGLSAAQDASGRLGLGVAHGGIEVSGSAPYRPPAAPAAALTGGSDGSDVDAASIVPPGDGQGMNALTQLTFPGFNLLCLPGVTSADVDAVTTALAYCATQHAFLLVDPDPSVAVANAGAKILPFGGQGTHGAIYWPRLITTGAPTPGLPPCGAVAGMMARTDTARGVWKAPAGLNAGLASVISTAYPTNDDVSGALNGLGINVIRSFTGAGIVVWGARTMGGSDIAGSPFKYVPIRRITDYIESSLYLGTQFAVFEPNDPVLWGQLRLAVTGFMRGLFRQGAFQQSPDGVESKSFFVTCDETVNPQTEIDAGRVNVVVGFAPLKLAEFVVITITHITDPGA
jgi:hypothetical protein